MCFARGFHFVSPSANRGRGEYRALDAPAASHAVKKQSIRVSHHEYTGTTRHSPRDGLRLLRALPGAPGFLATIVCVPWRKLDTSVGVSGPHAFAVRVRCRRLRHPPRPSHPAPRFVTLRNAPLPGRDGEAYRVIWVFGKAESCPSALRQNGTTGKSGAPTLRGTQLPVRLHHRVPRRQAALHAADGAARFPSAGVPRHDHREPARRDRDRSGAAAGFRPQPGLRRTRQCLAAGFEVVSRQGRTDPRACGDAAGVLPSPTDPPRSSGLPPAMDAQGNDTSAAGAPRPLGTVSAPAAKIPADVIKRLTTVTVKKPAPVITATPKAEPGAAPSPAPAASPAPEPSPSATTEPAAAPSPAPTAEPK